MTELIIEPTNTAQWQRLVQEASSSALRELDEELESYLVFLLMRFCRRPDVLARTMGLEYLRSLEVEGRVRNERLREVGDQCLLFAGMFPHIARRRRVRISYFIDLGRGAYQQLSQRVGDSAARLYAELCAGFVMLTDVLHSMRELQGAPCLAPLEAMELWQDTGSERALASLRRHTTGMPVMGKSSRRH